MARKPEKPDKKTRQEIARVIGKYTDPSRRYMLPSVYAAAGTLNLIALGIDALGGSGLATLTLNSVALPAAFTAGGGYWLYSMRRRAREKPNGQTIIAGEIVSDTLDAMETRLRRAFAKASRPDAPKLAAADLKTLAPAFQVIGGGEYLFIVETRKNADGSKEQITLQRKLAEMQAAKEEITAPAPNPAHDPVTGAAPKPPPRRDGFQL
jgi:hypothetical protein